MRWFFLSLKEDAVFRALFILATLCLCSLDSIALELKILPENGSVAKNCVLGGVVEIVNNDQPPIRFNCPSFIRTTLWFTATSSEKDAKIVFEHPLPSHPRKVFLETGERIMIPFLLMNESSGKPIFDHEGEFRVEAHICIAENCAPGKGVGLSSPPIIVEVVLSEFSDEWGELFIGSGPILVFFPPRDFPCLERFNGFSGYNIYMLYENGGAETSAAVRGRVNVDSALCDKAQGMVPPGSPGYLMWEYFRSIEMRKGGPDYTNGDYIVDF
jgi:hypothetical protein